ncbi:uncharacterized protein CANTADRAFT_113117 [Suhomyces tanzawaensis NRRL Y-17324]|uniref:Uncharacterized protein n=1 Tax=Suhomyces tanzawaensis NRRL Y-17324 TaxID=984487 RepID=A0A1E4SQ26_9ASCO|nr:uncharacterized protein CANTADRAFT_113117 [Suhomyces tanzawaensis NRRL Y-17324]ODV81611.1 hypothetical protein CANTADRAFT_113117 [Suhomyces tanzawaensis NRRL Y-17324]
MRVVVGAHEGVPYWVENGPNGPKRTLDRVEQRQQPDPRLWARHHQKSSGYRGDGPIPANQQLDPSRSGPRTTLEKTVPVPPICRTGVFSVIVPHVGERYDDLIADYLLTI